MKVSKLSMHAPNKRASKYMKQKLVKLQREIDKPMIIFGDFKPPYFSWKNKDIEDLNNTISHLDLFHIYGDYI